MLLGRNGAPPWKTWRRGNRTIPYLLFFLGTHTKFVSIISFFTTTSLSPSVFVKICSIRNCIGGAAFASSFNCLRFSTSQRQSVACQRHLFGLITAGPSGASLQDAMHMVGDGSVSTVNHDDADCQRGKYPL
ncbi:hypothetical protein EDB89DRAFT_739950 [Lactarius sanguifluus]|nr:hypothetical protein EDB89DRAFT_739950 [Lactarius sanguifluus]